MSNYQFKRCTYLIQDTISGSRAVDGYAVGGTPYQIGVHRDPRGGWVASDWVTGMRVGHTFRNSKPACVDEAVRNMDERGGPKFVKRVQDEVIKLGLFKADYPRKRL